MQLAGLVAGDDAARPDDSDRLNRGVELEEIRLSDMASARFQLGAYAPDATS